MEILWTILGLLGLFIVVTLIRAVFFKEKKKENVKLEPEMVNMEKYCQDLSDAINEFIENKKVIDIKFSTSCFKNNDEQIYCFSALILYEE